MTFSDVGSTPTASTKLFSKIPNAERDVYLIREFNFYLSDSLGHARGMVSRVETINKRAKGQELAARSCLPCERY